MERTATHLLSAVQTVDVFAFQLSVQHGQDVGRVCDVNAGRARIGAAPGSDLRLADKAVSRIHCELFMTKEGLRVRDCGSKNGTWLNGVQVVEAMVGHGALLTVGATGLRITYASTPGQLQISAHDTFGSLVGTSVEMRRIYTILERVAPTERTVLIQGETGTGKELVARAIHEASNRSKASFVTIDCSALSESLIESELFGHAKGAFTGAERERAGLFEQANGGTLFLDEIGELPLSLQPRLLRALESREIRRVGGNRSEPIDVRVVAATHRRLEQAVNEGRFREDLYYRLAVVELHVPPLRSRAEDIPLLAAAFYERFSDGATMPPEWTQLLMQRSWPGNVRELRNFVERSLVLGISHDASGNSLPGAIVGSEQKGAANDLLQLPLKEARVAWGERFELEYLLMLMQRADGNVTRAAELAGINRRTLQRMLVAYPAHFPRA
jgi:transcriptional regulator with PAS, ATPase and Fis domain